MDTTHHDVVCQQIITLVKSVGSCTFNDIEVSTAFEKLGFDELDRFELVIKCEDHFAIEITDQEAEQCATISDIVQLVAARKTQL